MSNLGNLKFLELIDLMLDSGEALTLLDQVCYDCCLTLHTLKLVNPTKYTCELIHIGVFLNLQVHTYSFQSEF
jgi:F-box protein 39